MAKLKEIPKIDLQIIGENFEISVTIPKKNRYYISEIFPESTWRINHLRFSLEQIPDIIDVLQTFQEYMEAENGANEKNQDK